MMRTGTGTEIDWIVPVEEKVELISRSFVSCPDFFFSKLPHREKQWQSDWNLLC
jgi:hypothetical protein